MKRYRLVAPTLAAWALITNNFAASPATAQQTFDSLKRKSDNVLALIDAEDRKSELCAGFENKPVKLTPFSFFGSRKEDFAPKGEFETTAAYKNRVSAAKNAMSGTYVLDMPVDRDFISYDADHKTLTVEVGAFGEGFISKEAGAEAAAWGIIPQEALNTGIELPYRQKEQVTGRYTAENAFGHSVVVKNVARQTSGLLSSSKLFP